MDRPEDMKPVLGKIRKLGDLGWSEWYEIVCWSDENQEWEPFGRVFNGEKVVAWCEILDDDSEVWNK